MKRGQISAVIWDLDDTLIDTAPSYLVGQREALALLGVRPDQEPHALALWNYLFTYFGQRDRSSILRAIVLELGLPPPAPEQLAEIAAGVRMSWQVGVGPRPGARAVLAFLSARRVQLGVVSNGDPEPQLAKLDQAGLSAYFAPTHRVFVPMISEQKPSPVGLLTCADALGVPTAACCYIGDAATDVIAAKLAGMTSILVREVRGVGQFAIERPDIAATDLFEVQQMLADITPHG